MEVPWLVEFDVEPRRDEGAESDGGGEYSAVPDFGFLSRDVAAVGCDVPSKAAGCDNFRSCVFEEDLLGPKTARKKST